MKTRVCVSAIVTVFLLLGATRSLARTPVAEPVRIQSSLHQGWCMGLRKTQVVFVPCSSSMAQVWLKVGKTILSQDGRCLGVARSDRGAIAQLLPCHSPHADHRSLWWNYDVTTGALSAAAALKQKGIERWCLHKKHNGAKLADAIHLWDCVKHSKENWSWNLVPATACRQQGVSAAQKAKIINALNAEKARQADARRKRASKAGNEDDIIDDARSDTHYWTPDDAFVESKASQWIIISILGPLETAIRSLMGSDAEIIIGATKDICGAKLACRAEWYSDALAGNR